MKKQEPIPEIADAVLYWMPDASEEEQKQATVRLRSFLAVMYRIYLRLESEGRFPLSRDNSKESDTVNS